MINWEEIKDNYPKAWGDFSMWFDGGKGRTNTLAYMSRFFSRGRRLFDFFDERDLEVAITPFFKLFQADIITKEGNVIVGTNFDNRKEAEKAAFVKAFELLEEKLK